MLDATITCKPITVAPKDGTPVYVIDVHCIYGEPYLFKAFYNGKCWEACDGNERDPFDIDPEWFLEVSHA